MYLAKEILHRFLFSQREGETVKNNRSHSTFTILCKLLLLVRTSVPTPFPPLKVLLRELWRVWKVAKETRRVEKWRRFGCTVICLWIGRPSAIKSHITNRKQTDGHLLVTWQSSVESFSVNRKSEWKLSCLRVKFEWNKRKLGFDWIAIRVVRESWLQLTPTCSANCFGKKIDESIVLVVCVGTHLESTLQSFVRDEIRRLKNV